MTDQEAINRAQKELDTSSYLAELGGNPGLRAIHRNRLAWLLRLLRLARKSLREQPCGYRESAKDINVPTNADRIRAMSDEELAVYRANHYDNFCQNKPECGALLDTDEGIPEEMCVACALTWLRQPAEEDEDGKSSSTSA